MTAIPAPHDPFLKRFFFWSKDRFPLFNAVVAFGMAFSIKGLFAQIPWDLADIALGATFWMHLFLLRVMDEHKDFESDKTFHPDRAVQKGVITLAELRKLGFVAFVLEGLCIGYLTFSSKLVFLCWIILWIWSFLMLKEFFVKEWLRHRLIIYSLLHLLISPIMFVLGWLYYSEKTAEWNLNKIVILSTLSLSTGFMYELSRKNRSEEQDAKGELSFSILFGRKLNSFIISFISLVALYFGHLYLQQNNIYSYKYIAGSIVIYLAMLDFLIKFCKVPTEKNKKKSEGVVGLAVVWAFLASLIIMLLGTSS